MASDIVPTRGQIEERLERAQARLVRLKHQATAAATNFQRSATRMGASFAIGYAEGKAEISGNNLPTVAGADPKMLYGAAAKLAGAFVDDDRMSEVLEDVGDGVLCAWAHGKGRDSAR
jgi:hypothetical protein